MLINTAILTISETKNIEDNNSALFFLNKIQESGEIVSENKTVSTDKKEIMEILLKWLKKNSVDIIIIINGIETNKVNLTNEIFDEIKKNKSLNIRSILEKDSDYVNDDTNLNISRVIFIEGVYVIEIPESKQTIVDTWNQVLKVRYNKSNVTLNNYIKNLKVEPYYLGYGQLHKERAVDMKNEINKQIDLYLSRPKEENNINGDHIKEQKYFSEIYNKFIFVEVGSYLGESLELWGDLLEEKLKNDFLIISIDPYISYVTESDKNLKKNKYTAPIKMSQNIQKAYTYFINNISIKKWRDKHIHFRMNSHAGFQTLKNFNIKMDFCYLDGSHYYKDFKSDLKNYSNILKSKNQYKGKLCGDDYEVSYDELLMVFEKSEVDKILEENMTIDFVSIGKFNFHPGITLAMSETKIKIKKFSSGFWLTI